MLQLELINAVNDMGVAFDLFVTTSRKATFLRQSTRTAFQRTPDDRFRGGELRARRDAVYSLSRHY
jgi:hypothetical protein